MASHPRFMTSQHSVHYISLLYLISNWLYLTAYPLYLSHNTKIMDHITPIVCMITQAQYVWHHMNTYDITSTLYDIKRCYDIHTHCIHVITPRIPVTASIVAELLLTVYWLYHICNMCFLKPTICMTSYEFYVTSQLLFITSQDCIHDITSTFFMTSHPLYTTWHTLYLWYHSHCNYDKTPTMFDIILSVYDISHGEWMATQGLYLTWYPFYLCNQTHLIDDITPYVHMKSHPLHA